MDSLNSINIAISNYIKRFYLYRILKGLILSFAILSLIYFSLILLHHNFYLTIALKTLIFWFFIILSIVILSDFVLIDLLKYIKVFPQISKFKAADNISNSFPEMRDKLINTLELSSEDLTNPLIVASINQKVAQISIFNFAEAITYNELLKYLKYLLFPILLFLFLLILNKNVIYDGSKKFINYNVYYKPEAPFDFVLLNKSLTIQSGSDFTVKLKLTGKTIPSIVYIDFGNNHIPMVNVDMRNNIFSYDFKAVNSSFNFNFSANNFSSDNYRINIKPSPTVISYRIEVIPPSYTNKNQFILKNTADLITEYGSKIIFTVFTNSTDSLYFTEDSAVLPFIKGKDNFSLEITPKKSIHYSFVAKNIYFKNQFFKSNITIIPDNFPSINIETEVDSIVSSRYYFHGKISDDYGFTSLLFYLSVEDKTNKSVQKHFAIPFNKFQLGQEFYYMFDFNDLQLPKNSKIDYYFTVSDNDPFYPFKTSKTNVFSYHIPTNEELDSLIKDRNANVDSKLENANQLSFDIQMDISNFNQKSINENVSDWEKKQFLNNLFTKQQQLNSMVDSLKIDNQKKIEDLKQIYQKNDDLLKKQQEIQDLINQLMTDDLKKLLDSLNKLQNNFDDKKFNDLLKNYNEKYKDLSKNLERTKELLKRMEVEHELNSTVENLNELSKELQTLSKNIEKQKDISTSQQDSLLSNEFKFNQQMQNYDSLIQKNNALEKPYNLDSLNEIRNQIQNDYKSTKDQMFKDNKQKTSKNMQNTSKDIDKMSQQMSDMLQQSMQENNSEDEQTIQQILENILNFSFNQESILIQNTNDLSVFSTKFSNLIKNQLTLKNNYKIIADSLYALAKRNPAVSKAITDELANINTNLNNAISSLGSANKFNSAIYQQKVITSANKLALLLQESLEQMQQDQMQMPGNGQSKSKGKSQPSISDIMQFQQQLQQQLQGMLDQMKNGEKPNSEQIGEQYAQREQLQKMLQDMMNNGELSPEMQQILQQISQMNDDIKKDLINRNITPTTLFRDKQISTRLLEAQNAENQRKQSEQRLSNTANDQFHNVPDSLFKTYFKYNLNKDILKQNDIQLINFYNIYFNEYLHRVTF